jgi:hypothetical protein
VAILGGKTAIGSAADYKAAADCLGNVIVADIRPPGRVDPPGTQLVAWGVARPANAKASVIEEACVVVAKTAPSGQAGTDATLMESRAGGVLPAQGISFSQLAAKFTVDQLKKDGFAVVRLQMTDQAETRAGVLAQLDRVSGELGYLLGGAVSEVRHPPGLPLP